MHQVDKEGEEKVNMGHETACGGRFFRTEDIRWVKIPYAPRKLVDVRDDRAGLRALRPFKKEGSPISIMGL